jgi:ABC-type transport system involved in cytochrome c biogenesis permease component
MSKYDIIGLLIIYAIPICIAILRKHKYKLYIILITCLLGWTFIGWVIALMWALSEDH